MLVYCVDKIRENNVIKDYIIENSLGQRLRLSAQELKLEIFKGNLEVENLKLTSDGRLIDSNNKETNIQMDKAISNLKHRIDYCFETLTDINKESIEKNLNICMFKVLNTLTEEYDMDINICSKNTEQLTYKFKTDNNNILKITYNIFDGNREQLRGNIQKSIGLSLTCIRDNKQYNYSNFGTSRDFKEFIEALTSAKYSQNIHKVDRNSILKEVENIIVDTMKQYIDISNIKVNRSGSGALYISTKLLSTQPNRLGISLDKRYVFNNKTLIMVIDTIDNNLINIECKIGTNGTYLIENKTLTLNISNLSFDKIKSEINRLTDILLHDELEKHRDLKNKTLRFIIHNIASKSHNILDIKPNLDNYEIVMTTNKGDNIVLSYINNDTIKLYMDDVYGADRKELIDIIGKTIDELSTDIYFKCNRYLMRKLEGCIR